MAKRKKLKAKELKRDPFREWYERQAEWVRHHQELTRRTVVTLGVVIALLVAGSLSYSGWTGTAEHRLARAFDIFNASVGDTPPANPLERSYKTEEEKYRAALAAYKRVAEAWYYRFSDYHDVARYYEALCQLHLNPSEGQSLLVQLSQGHSVTARLARLALAEHLVAKGKAARAEALYRQLTKEPGPLPKYQLRLGLARALEREGKKEDAVALYVEVAKERAQESEGREAIARLAALDPAALDQLPENPTSSAPRDALARYRKK